MGLCEGLQTDNLSVCAIEQVMVFFYGLSQDLYFHYIGVSTLLERAGRVILLLFKIKIEISKK